MKIERRRGMILRLFFIKTQIEAQGGGVRLPRGGSPVPLKPPTVLGWVLVLFLCAVFSPARGEAAEILRITVPGVVQVEGAACALSDIARLEGSPELVERAGALLLTVRDGGIERQQVIDALKVSGLEGVRVELKMPALVRAEVMAVPDGPVAEEHPEFSENDRELAVLIKNLAAWDGEVEVQHQGAVPDGRLVSPASIVPGTSAATLRFRDASGKERSLAVRLTWSQAVLVLTRSVKKDEPLRASDVVVRQIRIGKPGVYASRPEEVVGRSLRKNLSQGEPVLLNLISSVPIIERGKSVTIVVHSGGLTVRARGEALESGGLGDTIKVRNVSGKTVVSAVVTGKDTVEVKVP